MELKIQLKHFIKNNSNHKFRISTCKDTKKKVIQMYLPDDPDSQNGWFCLHEFYEANNHFKLGYGFNVTSFKCFRCKETFENIFRSKVDEKLCKYCEELDDDNGELKEN